MSTTNKIVYFLSRHVNSHFSRKDYLLVFKEISSAMVSRDLKYAVEKGLVEKIEDKRLTKYRSIIK